MTDLEMTKLCAEAMWIDTRSPWEAWWRGVASRPTLKDYPPFDPLHDDAQAMALVKKLELDISHCEPSGWIVFSGDGDGIDAIAEDLNRAIVECVAKMQSAKK